MLRAGARIYLSVFIAWMKYPKASRSRYMRTTARQCPCRGRNLAKVRASNGKLRGIALQRVLSAIHHTRGLARTSAHPLD